MVNVTPQSPYSRERDRHPLCRILGGPQGLYLLVRKISPSRGFDLRTGQPVVSRYIPPTLSRPTHVFRIYVCIYVCSPVHMWVMHIIVLLLFVLSFYPLLLFRQLKTRLDAQEWRMSLSDGTDWKLDRNNTKVNNLHAFSYFYGCMLLRIFRHSFIRNFARLPDTQGFSAQNSVEILQLFDTLISRFQDCCW